MKELGKTCQYEIYTGAGHAYMRRGDDPGTAQKGPGPVMGTYKNYPEQFIIQYHPLQLSEGR